MVFCKNAVIVASVCAAIFLVTGCSVKNNSIDLDSAPVIQFDQEWAVIIEPYALFRQDADFSADTTAHGRRGDVICVTGKKILYSGNKQSVWYNFEQGWLPDTSVQIYSNQLKAQNAAAGL